MCNTTRLYIIGNGFDLYHGIKSKYSDFKEFVEENDNKLFETLEKYFNSDELWSDFEGTLAYLDTETICDNASNYLESYAAEDWRDAYHHDYQYEIQRAIDVITVDLKEKFTEWILQLEISLIEKYILPLNSKYLTFNYTDTLELIYNIPSENILYIHNKAITENSNLILGHSRQPSEQESFNDPRNIEDQDVRVTEGNQILDNYFKETYKNTETIISENAEFFRQLADIEEIFIIGHSLSKVDIKYFEIITNNVNNNVKWTVTYYGNEEKSRHLHTLLELGIQQDKINLIQITEI